MFTREGDPSEGVSSEKTPCRTPVSVCLYKGGRYLLGRCLGGQADSETAELPDIGQDIPGGS